MAVGAATARSLTGDETVIEVDPVLVRVNPRQPRRHFSETAIAELTSSVKRHGVIAPLLVRRTDLGYELIAGERRLRASRAAGLKKIPVIVQKAATDRDQLELALVENLQREDLNPIEEARGYDRLANEFTLTQEEIAERVGKDRTTVTNLIRLLKLAQPVQEMLAAGSISMGHARALLGLEDPRRQQELATRIGAEGLSVRQAEELVRKLGKPKTNRRAADQAELNANLRHLSEELQRKLGTRVEIVTKGKGGEIRITYFSPDDLSRLSDRLLTGIK